MLPKLQDAIWAAVLSAICGLLVWHAVRWHMAGMYSEMFQWVETEKEYVTVVYNIVLMLVLGMTTGLLMVKITDLLGYKVQARKDLDEDT